MNSHNITFLVFTLNEERRLPSFMRCINGYGDIVVIDNYSSDATLDIAQRYTDRVFLHHNPGYIENQETMSFVLKKVRTRWAYLAFVDEFLPKRLLNILLELSLQDRYTIVEIYRKNFMYGREVFNYGKHHLRMFVPGSVDYEANVVHKLGNYLVPRSEVYRVPKTSETSLWHFSSYTTRELEGVHTRYANIEAPQRSHILHQSFSGVRALWKLVFYFWGTYIGLGGFRGGWPGLFISIQIAYFKFSVEARLWEIDNGVTVELVEALYDKWKAELTDAPISS